MPHVITSNTTSSINLYSNDTNNNHELLFVVKACSHWNRQIIFII